jgi:hypothetical protein
VREMTQKLDFEQQENAFIINRLRNQVTQLEKLKSNNEATIVELESKQNNFTNLEVQIKTLKE